MNRPPDVKYPVGGWSLSYEHVEKLLSTACANPPYAGDSPIVEVKEPFDRMRLEFQASMNSCTAHAATSVAEWCAVVATHGKTHPEYSRQWLYCRTRLKDGWRSDSGSSIFQATQILIDRGAPPEELWPYTGYDHWQPPKGRTWEEVDAAALPNALAQRVILKGYDSVLQWCNRGRGGVVFGAQVDNAMRNCRGTLEDYTGQGRDGHALSWFFPSPKKDREGRNYIWGPNSWGTRWGNRGWCEYAPTYVDKVTRWSPFGAIGLTDMKNIVDRPIDFRVSSPMRD